MRSMRMGLTSGLVSLAIALPALSAVKGKISHPNGQPVSNAVVRLQVRGIQDTTGANGEYSLLTPVAVEPGSLHNKEGMTLNRGVLEIRPAQPTWVKVEVFDTRGLALKKASSQLAAGGVFRLDLADIFRVADMALIRVSTSQGVTTFPLLSLFGGNHVGHLSSGEARSIQGAMAKRSAAIDTLKVTAAGFKTKTMAISSYDTTVDVSLEANACQPSGYAGKDILTIGDSWIAMPGNQVTRLLTLMKEAGVLGANETSDRREVSGNTLDKSSPNTTAIRTSSS